MATKHRCRVYPPPPGSETSYRGSINMEFGQDGFVPAYDHGEMSGSGDKLHYFVTAIEAKGPGGNPRQYVFVNKSCYRFEDNTLTLDGSFADVVQGAVITEDGATPPVETLLAFFGDSGTVNGHYYRSLTTDTAPWTINSGATKTQGWLAANVGPDTYLVTGSVANGRTTLGEHMVAKCAPGLDRRTAANWGPGEPVGEPSWPIIGLVPFRYGVLATKGTGAYAQDEVRKGYFSVRALQEKLTHGLNGKATAPSENGVWFSMEDGTLFEFDGSQVFDATPWKDAPLPPGAGIGRIEFIADRGDKVAVGRACWYTRVSGPRATAALGFRIFKVQGAGETVTELTADVTDNSFATPAAANMGGWGANATDRLIWVSDRPLLGIVPRVVVNSGSITPNAAAQYFTQPECKGGAGTFVSLGNIIDATILSTANTSLVLTGFPPGANEPFLGGDAINAFALAQPDSITLSGIGTLTGKYIYQVRPGAAGVAMTATTTIQEVDVVEALPGLGLGDPSGPFQAANDFTSLARSGALLEIYFGDRQGAHEYTWSHPYSLWTKGGGELVAAWTAARTGALTNGGNALCIYGRFVQMVVAEGSNRRPAQTPYARVTQYTSTEPGPMAALRPLDFRESDGTPADPDRLKRILAFDCGVKHLQPDDVLRGMIDHLDGRGPWVFRTGSGSPLRLESRGGNAAGYEADAYFLLHDTSQNDAEWVPRCRWIDMEWEYVDGDRVNVPMLNPRVE